MGLDILKFTELYRADTYFGVEITNDSCKCRRLKFMYSLPVGLSWSSNPANTRSLWKQKLSE